MDNPCYSADLFLFSMVFMIRFASIGKLITLLDFTLIQQPENTRQRKFLFKQLKQNFPIKFFLGGHENAIRMQIWSAQAVNLLLTVIRKKAKCKWGGAILQVSMDCICSIILMNQTASKY
jgi:hypothetical protein